MVLEVLLVLLVVVRLVVLVYRCVVQLVVQFAALQIVVVVVRRPMLEVEVEVVALLPLALPELLELNVVVVFEVVELDWRLVVRGAACVRCVA